MKEEEMVTSTPESTMETTNTAVPTPEVPAENVEMPAVASVEQPVVSTVEQTPVEAAPVVESTPEVTNEVQSTPVESPEAAPVEAPATSPVETPVTSPVDTPPVNDAPEAPIGEATTPVTLEAPADPTAKKSKKGLIIAIVAILVILIGLGVTFYITQYKSASKRIDVIVDELFKNISYSEKINQINKKQSGTYTLSASGDIKSNDKSVYSGSIELNGNYGYDLDKKDAYATLDLENLVFNKNSLLGATGINASGEIEDSTIYIGVKELLDKVITDTSDDYGETWDEIKNLLEQQNDSVNVNVLIAGVQQALKDGINSVEAEQSVASVEGIGTTNVIKIKINYDNAVKISNTFRDSLLNNAAFMKEYAKLTDSKEDDAKKSLESSFTTSSISKDLDETIEIYSPLFGNALKGFKVTNKNEKSDWSCASEKTNVVKVIVDGSKYKITADYPEQGTANLELTLVSNNNETTIAVTGTVKSIVHKSRYSSNDSIECEKVGTEEYTVDVKYEYKNDHSSKQSLKIAADVNGKTSCTDKDYCDEGTAGVKLDINEQLTIDASYKESSIDKEKAVKAEELTQEDMLTIANNLSTNMGTLGQYIYYYLFGTQTSTDYSDYSTYSYGY